MTTNVPSPNPIAPESGDDSPTTPPAELDELCRKHFEALVQRINDTYARFTPEEMEMLKWLGWG
jgi:hypothetical protein